MTQGLSGEHASSPYGEAGTPSAVAPSTVHDIYPKLDTVPGVATQVDSNNTVVSEIRRSQLAFKDMIQEDKPMDMIISFLEDPKLNVFEAQNLQCLLTVQSRTTTTDPKKTQTLCRWLSRQVALGLLPHDEVVSTVEIITGNSEKRRLFSSCEDLSRAVFEGTSLSTVYQGEDSLMIHSFNDYLSSLPLGALSWATQNLGIEMIKSLRVANENPLKMRLRVFLQVWYSIKEPDVKEQDVVCKSQTRASKLLDMLQHIPRHLLLDFLHETHRKFFKRLFAMNGGRSAILEQWSRLEEPSFLRELLPRFEAQMAREKIANIAEYLQLMDHRAKCSFLLRHWYETKLAYHSKAGLSFPSALEARFQRSLQENPNRSPFINLLLSLRSLDYNPPAETQSRLLRLLRALDMSGIIVALIASSEMHHVHFGARVVQAEIYHHLSIGKQRIAYKIFRSYHKLPIEHVPELAEVIISRPNLHSEVALRLRHSRQKWLGCTKEFTQNRLTLRDLRTSTLNRMALAYAKAPHLRPIWAFRKVYACYQTLRTEHLPVQPDITRAMTHAGVIRFLLEGEWVSTIRFMQILRLVREVEGEEVAEQLDRSLWDWRREVLGKGRENRDRELEEGSRVGCFVRSAFPRTAVGPRRTRRPCAKWWKCDGE